MTLHFQLVQFGPSSLPQSGDSQGVIYCHDELCGSVNIPKGSGSDGQPIQCQQIKWTVVARKHEINAHSYLNFESEEPLTKQEGERERNRTTPSFHFHDKSVRLQMQKLALTDKVKKLAEVQTTNKWMTRGLQLDIFQDLESFLLYIIIKD